MLSVALTGNVAAGKSLVAELWRALGVPVVSADELAREVVAPGSGGLRAVLDEFGDDVRDPRGGLDRERLRELVFADAGARERLERILHPLIRDRRDDWIEARRREGAELVVSEIPLLFEVGMEGAFDVVVLVDAPPDERLDRLVRDRGLEPAQARRIMASQMDAGDKRSRAHHVLENDGTPEELRDRAAEFLERLRARARSGGSSGEGRA